MAAICEALDLHPDWSLWTDDGSLPPTENPRKEWESTWKPVLKHIERLREATRQAAADDPTRRARV